MLIAVGFAGECVSVVRSPEPAGREVLAESAALGPHYQDTWIWIARSWMRLARGDTDGALADQRKSLRSARRALDPQVLCPALSGSAYVLAMAGRAGQAQPVLSEQFGLSLAEGGTLDESSVDFVLAAEILGRLDEARRWLRARRDSPWSVAVRQLADREFAAAAEALDSMGALFADLYQPSREPLCLVAAYSTVTVWM